MTCLKRLYAEFCAKICNCTKTYIRQTAASIMILFALMAPIVIGAAGMALDFAQAYLVRERLTHALDAAAIAAAASSAEGAELEQLLESFFNANYPPEKIGVTYNLNLEVVGDDIKVSADADYNTSFLRVIGIDEITVYAQTIVRREVRGVEVVLVVDNTGSMSRNDNIDALRTASANFVNILFDRTSDERYIKIGMVPYSTSVNVGSYGFGENPDGSNYGASFVNNPLGVDYDPVYNRSSSDTDWMGCVLAHDYPLDTQDHEGPWDMYRFCRDDNATEDPICVGKKGSDNRSPNYICPETPILPLGNNRQALLDNIDTMEAKGHTLGNFGMAWGYRVISPEFPFEEGSGWEDPEWRKAVVMMTDGVNTMHPHYSAYGPTWEHSINSSDQNDRFAETCQYLKDNNVLIYTVTFAGGVNEATKQFYRQCATSPEYYHDAPEQEDLIDVFEQISRELSNLHIRG